MPSARRPTVTFRVLLDEPPADPDLDFGLQDKDGHVQPGSPMPDGSCAFETSAQAVVGPGTGVRLRGPTIHGPADKQFLYLSARRKAAAIAFWQFRMKVPLPRVDTGGSGAAAAAPIAYEVRIRATGGGTVQLPGDGWRRITG